MHRKACRPYNKQQLGVSDVRLNAVFVNRSIELWLYITVLWGTLVSQDVDKVYNADKLEGVSSWFLQGLGRGVITQLHVRRNCDWNYC